MCVRSATGLSCSLTLLYFSHRNSNCCDENSNLESRLDSTVNMKYHTMYFMLYPCISRPPAGIPLRSGKHALAEHLEPWPSRWTDLASASAKPQAAELGRCCILAISCIISCIISCVARRRCAVLRSAQTSDPRRGLGQWCRPRSISRHCPDIHQRGHSHQVARQRRCLCQSELRHSAARRLARPGRSKGRPRLVELRKCTSPFVLFIALPFCLESPW